MVKIRNARCRVTHCFPLKQLKGWFCFGPVGRTRGQEHLQIGTERLGGREEPGVISRKATGLVLVPALRFTLSFQRAFSVLEFSVSVFTLRAKCSAGTIRCYEVFKMCWSLII